MSGRRGDNGLAPPRRASCGEGGKASTLDVAKAIADYAR